MSSSVMIYVMTLTPPTNIMLCHNKLLMSLMNLEIMTMIMITFISIFQYSSYKSEIFTLMMIMTVSVCETSILLMILMAMNRKFSTDNLTSLSLCKS